MYRSGATLTERRSIPFPVSLAPSSVHSSRLRKRIEKLNRARFFANTFFGLLYFFFLNLESGDENVKRTFGGGNFSRTCKDWLLNRIVFENLNNKARIIAWVDDRTLMDRVKLVSDC